MKVYVNGKEKTLKEGATLKDAVAGEKYVEGSTVSIYLSTEKVTEVTNDFAIVTSQGEMVLHLYDTPEAKLFRKYASEAVGSHVRWANKELVATLADALDLPKSSVVFKSGETSKTKRILLRGVTAAQVQGLFSRRLLL